MSAVAGHTDIMAHVEKEKVGAEGFTPQLGTLSGNPIAAAAGLATLAILKRPGATRHSSRPPGPFGTGVECALKEAGLQALMLGDPPMFDALFTARMRITDYRGSIDFNGPMSRR